MSVSVKQPGSAPANTGAPPVGRAGGAMLLDGKAVAAKVRAEVAQRAADFAARHGRRPGLAVVQVGDHPASSVYVRNKRRSSRKRASSHSPTTYRRLQLRARS